MERISAKHGARLDDELARETETLTRATPSEARAEEWRMAEPPGDGEPLPDARLTGDRPGLASGALPLDEIEARADLAAALRPTAFPADAPTLRRVADEQGAPAWVLDVLTRVDQVQRFDTVGDLWRAAGGHRDGGNGREPVDGVGVGAPVPESAIAAASTTAAEPQPPARRPPLESAAARAPQPAVPAAAPDGGSHRGSPLGRGVGLVIGLGAGVVREGVRTAGWVVRGARRILGR